MGDILRRTTLIIRDAEVSACWYQTVFGSAAAPKDKARSNFGIPFNYTDTVWRNAAALAPVEGESGRVEVMQIAASRAVT